MQHPIGPSTLRVTLARDFDYLTAGEVYRCTPSVRRSGKRKGAIDYWRFDRDDESSGTFLRPFQMDTLRREPGAVVEPYRR